MYSFVFGICRSSQVDSEFNHHRSVGKVERIWKMVVSDGKYMLLIKMVAKYFFFL